MADTVFQYERSEAGEQAVLLNERLEVRWESGAQLVIRDLTAEQATVAGGPLIELAPVSGERRPRTLGLGFDHMGAEPPKPLRFVDSHGAGMQLERSFPIAVESLTVHWNVRVYDRHPFVRCALSLRNTGADSLTVRRVFPFVTGSWWGTGALRIGDVQDGFAAYKTGWQSWSYAGGLPFGIRDPRPRSRALAVWHNPAGREPRQPITGVVDVVSDGVALLGQPDRTEAFLAGFLAQDRWLTQVYVQRKEGALAACALTDDYVLEPGESMDLPPLLLALGAGTDLLVQYAEALGREQGARRGARPPVGWCSWYQYFHDVSEEAVLENVMAMRAVRASVPCEVVLIDDGYETAVGDWLSLNERFPHGMPYLSERIREAGYRMGLWLAPFTVAANSRLAQEHPTWLVYDDTGEPAFGGQNWGADLYSLDTSHPDARDWLRTVIRTIVDEWGCDFLKLDFLASGALKGQRYEAQVTRAQALRMGLELIREAAGDEVFLLGCGCPLLSAVGTVDAMRIGPDSATHWKPRHRGLPLPLSEGHSRPALEGALRNTFERAWMTPALWVNDPDCLLLRDAGSELTADEVRAFATAVGLTGGMVLLSDAVKQLTVERLDFIARLLPPMPERALPFNMFEYGIPERVGVRIERPWGSWLLVGLFNTSAFERELTVTWPEVGLAPDEYHVVEFWTGAYLGVSETGAAVRVGGHGAAVLAIHAARAEPMLLSTSFHISQGGVEIDEWTYDRERGVVQWETQLGRQAVGTFMLWLPEPLRPKRVSSTAAHTTWSQGTAGQVVVTAEIHDEARFTLELEGAP
jgi:alpha-galactosidase